MASSGHPTDPAARNATLAFSKRCYGDDAVLAEVRRRRTRLVPYFLGPLLVGVAFVSMGLEAWDSTVLEIVGFGLAIAGFALVATAAVYLGFASSCPACGKLVPLQLLQASVDHGEHRCRRCGVRLG